MYNRYYLTSIYFELIGILAISAPYSLERHGRFSRVSISCHTRKILKNNVTCASNTLLKIIFLLSILPTFQYFDASQVLCQFCFVCEIFRKIQQAKAFIYLRYHKDRVDLCKH